MKLRVGQTLTSPVDTTSLVVVRAPTDDVAVTCGGAAMVPRGEAPPPGAAPAGGAGGGLVLGKRYADEALGIELLCVKGGDHAVAVNGTTLVQKSAKPLPASD